MMIYLLATLLATSTLPKKVKIKYFSLYIQLDSKDVINEFIKQRFNNSLESIGITKIFEVDEALVKKTEWFDDEIIGTKHGDFFVKRSINYSKRTKSITSDDLF